MQDTKEKFDSLLNDPQLDRLLERAHEQASKIAVTDGDVPAEQAVQQIDEQVQGVTAKSAQVRSELVGILAERRQKRAEKAAVVVHMYKTACRLLN